VTFLLIPDVQNVTDDVIVHTWDLCSSGIKHVF